MNVLLLVGLLSLVLPINEARADPMSQKDGFLAREEALYNGCVKDPESLRPVLQATHPVVDYSLSAKNKDELKIIMSNPNIKANISRAELVRKDTFDIKTYCTCRLEAINNLMNSVSGSGDQLMLAIGEAETQATGQCLDQQIQ